MWIRSQDKSVLTKVTGVNVCDNENGTYDIDGAYWRLGTYKTKKRALEVLDEIQNSIVSLEIVRNTDYFNKLASISSENDFTKDSEKVCIYQMPEE